MLAFFKGATVIVANDKGVPRSSVTFPNNVEALAILGASTSAIIKRILPVINFNRLMIVFYFLKKR
jgi:hypothetical protein